MNHLRGKIERYERRAMAHANAECDWDIELRYEAWGECYKYICIRDAIRYPGRVAEPTLRQWLDSHKEEYERTKTRIYEELENRIATQVYDYSQGVCGFLKDNSERFRQFTETLQGVKE